TVLRPHWHSSHAQANLSGAMDETESLKREILHAENVLLDEVTVRTMQALAQSQERFKSHFKYLPFPAYIWKWNGADLVLVECNAAGEAITRGAIQKYIGVPAKVMYADYNRSVAEDLHRCFAERVTIRREMTYEFRSLGFAKEMV